MNRRKEITENTFIGLGFKRQELTDFFHAKGKRFNFGLPPLCSDDEIFEAQLRTSEVNPSISEITPPNINQNLHDQIDWEPKFEGRTAALEIIGAISIILVEKSGNKYQYGSNISASAIAEDVATMMDKSPANYRKLISEALKISGLAKD